MAIGNPISWAPAATAAAARSASGAPAGGELAARQQVERDRAPAGEHALVEVLGDLNALLSGGEGDLNVPGRDRREGAVEEVPGHTLQVLHHPGGLDRAVEHVRGLRHAALHPQRRAQHRVDQREEIPLPGAAADVQRPLGVAARRRELVEVHLRGRQVHQRVEAPGQLVVADLVNQRGRLLTMIPRLGDDARERARDGAHAERRGHERPVAQRRRRLLRTRRPVAHRVVLAPVEGVDRELDHERDGLGRAGIAELGKGALQMGPGLLMAPEQVFDGGARRDEPDAQRRVSVLRHDPHALEQAGVAVREPPGGRERSRVGEQELDPLLCGCGPRQHSPRGGEPVRGARGRRAAARAAAASPASRRTATASRSPSRAAISTWCARAVAGAPRSASATAVRS